jgi:hypothetical protein
MAACPSRSARRASTDRRRSSGCSAKAMPLSVSTVWTRQGNVVTTLHRKAGQALAQADRHVVERQQCTSTRLDHHRFLAFAELGAARLARSHRRIGGRGAAAPLGHRLLVQSLAGGQSALGPNNSAPALLTKLRHIEQRGDKFLVRLRRTFLNDCSHDCQGGHLPSSPASRTAGPSTLAPDTRLKVNRPVVKRRGFYESPRLFKSTVHDKSSPMVFKLHAAM